MKRHYHLLAVLTLFGVAIAGQQEYVKERSDGFRKMIDLPADTGVAAQEPESPSGLNFALAGCTFLSDYTITGQLDIPVFNRGIIRQYALQHRKDKDASVKIQVFVGSGGRKDMKELLIETIVNSSMPLDLLAKRFGSIKGKHGGLLLGNENPDGSISNCFALARGNVGILVVYYGDATLDLSPWVREIDDLLSKSAKVNASFDTDDNMYSLPRKMDGKKSVLCKKLHKAGTGAADVTIDAVAEDQLLVIHKLKDESLEITATDENGATTIGLVYYNLSTLNSTWKLFPVHIGKEK